MKVQWTLSAVDDLEHLREVIERDRPMAASVVAKQILDSVDRILRYPAAGKHGRMKGTQELVVPGYPYVLVYRTSKNRIQILRVLHGRRRWPPKGRKQPRSS